MEKEPITIKGLEKLKKELVFLKEKKRPKIVAAITEARSHGDLKENAEYHAAKEQQSLNEGKIQEIEDLIARANVIDVTKINNDGKVIFGSTVFLQNLDTGEKIYYHIVGKTEADLKQNLIYYKSPIGKGLIGKNKKDSVEIITPSGVKNFEIDDVKYIEFDIDYVEFA
jgi:transcription elongation factor GreA